MSLNAYIKGFVALEGSSTVGLSIVDLGETEMHDRKFGRLMLMRSSTRSRISSGDGIPEVQSINRVHYKLRSALRACLSGIWSNAIRILLCAAAV